MTTRYMLTYRISPDTGPRLGSVVPDHERYWLEPQREMIEGGPFADRSGGLILFEAPGDDAAAAVAAGDPFAREGLLDQVWLAAWPRR